MLDHKASVEDAGDSEARRAFLLRCGRFAAVTPAGDYHAPDRFQHPQRG